MSPLQILQEKFGHTSFKFEQERIINAILDKRDALVLMPTAGGKSLCYQVPALIFGGLTVVISPLIALMKDQVDSLISNGIQAAYLNSSQPRYEQERILQRVQLQSLKLLYLAPESIYLKRLNNLNVSLIAIDEAHCISQWGHDFRPEYRMLSDLKAMLPDVPVIALTATADEITQRDIIERLALRNPEVFISSFNRTNIRYLIEPKKNSYSRVVEFLRRHNEDSGIIYCLSRVATEALATHLRENGFHALPYHAGMDRAMRSRNQEKFLNDEVRIIVATVAFGMGIDKPNVRFVIHMDLPKNIESYYQETGRAGRDGLPSEALLLFSFADVVKLRKLVEIEGNARVSEVFITKLQQMATYGALHTCRRKYILNYFGEEAPEHCGNCDVCLSNPERSEGTELAQKALTAIAGLRQRFGSGYVVDFLRGSRAGKIKAQHRTLTTYGIGAGISRDTWHAILNDLIAQGYIEQSTGEYPTLKLTRRSASVIRGKEKVMIAPCT
ncbi:DNA helicase RecQ [Chryseolinea sp. T2]|uniref:DNA helicase RecQ n=1 Tax=Chryseolinea sp. T2 TaxID=3129255 RepID=UPI003077B6AC